MKVDIFLTVYKARIKNKQNITDDLILQIIIDLIKPKEYIPFDDKVNIVDNTLNGTFDKKYPSIIQSRNFIINLINEYTNLEVDNAGYDLLCRAHLIDYILLSFESEFKICQNLLKMCLSDLYQKEIL